MESPIPETQRHSLVSTHSLQSRGLLIVVEFEYSEQLSGSFFENQSYFISATYLNLKRVIDK